MRAINSIEPLDTVADLAAAARAAASVLADAKREFPGLTRTRTIVLTDLAVNTWSAAIANNRGNAQGWELPAGAEIESVDEGTRENLSVDDISIDPAAPILDRPLEIAVRLKAFGRAAFDDVGVELFVDGVRVGRQQADVEASGEAIARFETRLVEAGRHVIEARLHTEGDALAADNRRWLVAEARAARRALLVADAPAAAEDLARALNPRHRESAGGDAIHLEIIPTAGLESAELGAYDAAFICNVAEPSERERRLLERYVKGGGAVVLVLGDRTHAAAYNHFLKESIALEMAEHASEGQWRLDPLDYRHRIMAPFAGRSRAGLLGAVVSKYHPLQVMDRGRVETALAFSSGVPALVIGEHGAGRLAVLATDPALQTRGEPWSTLAVSPSFVPLVRELFNYLTADRRGDQWNRTAGEPLAIDAALVEIPASGSVWKDPAGRTSATPPDSRRRGVYTVDGQAIAVNVDPAESDLDAIDAADVQKATPVENQVVVHGSAVGGGGWALASYLLGAAAVLMLVELTVAWLLGRGWA